MTNELLDENKLLIAKIKPLKEEVLDRIIVKSPVNGLIAYSLRDCLTILVEHEKRHYNQAIKLKQQIESSNK